MQPGDDDWLTSLLPVVLSLSSSASYAYGFVGSSFVTTSDGCLITANHVAEELHDIWWETRSSPVSERGMPGALYVPTSKPFLIPILDLKTFRNAAGAATDLALGLLALPAGPNNDLREMQSLGFSGTPVKVGDEVTMVGYLHGGESVNEGAQVITTGGALAAIPTVVTRMHDEVPGIPAPVFEMPCLMPGGMSGGPIFRTGTNEVVGVCSRGVSASDENPPYCYGSTIQPLLPLLDPPED
ncbi:trypsin-like peptidase domain-containing protein [Actinoplanes sp. NPDC026619]|uniref:trypsin-like peptidase domain-containing protein n=1 Tax=Actinoplanes sp. NPDC026619 TaxID=3155798 RepID=UPI0033ED55A4